MGGHLIDPQLNPCLQADGSRRKGCLSSEERAEAERVASRPVVAAGQPPPLCIYRGGLAIRSPKATTGQWVTCGNASHPLKTVEDPTGNTVCTCKGCGPGCSGYALKLPQRLPLPEHPWDYPVSICIPHLDTFEQLELGVALWRLQTIQPYLLVIDTGSPPEVLDRVRALQGPDLEVHCLQRYPQKHPSCNVSVALDLAHGLCRTSVLFHTHTDVFPRRRDFLEWMLGQCTPANPVVGWRMSPRECGPWNECVSHTATAIHNPTFRNRGLSWSLDGYLDSMPDEAMLQRGWPDTESGLWHTMCRAGIAPKLLGDDANHARLITDWFDHSRSYTAIKRWFESAGPTAMWERAKADMLAAEREARQRLAEWQKIG
jgi:hypothetical protein